MSVAHFLIVQGKYFSSKDVLHASQCSAFFQLACGIKTVTLEVVQPSTGPVCPGQAVVLTCTVARTGILNGDLFLTWSQLKPNSSKTTRVYDKDDQMSGSLMLGDFITTAEFMTSADSTMIVSNATLVSAALSNSDTSINCKSPPQANVQTTTITVAGMIGYKLTHNLIKIL